MPFTHLVMLEDRLVRIGPMQTPPAGPLPSDVHRMPPPRRVRVTSVALAESGDAAPFVDVDVPGDTPLDDAEAVRRAVAQLPIVRDLLARSPAESSLQPPMESHVDDEAGR